MSQWNRARVAYFIAALIVTAVGIASRNLSIGNVLWDKYAGDALYAVLLYLVLRLIWPAAKALPQCVTMASVAMFCIESFQLTGITLTIRQSDSQWLKLIAIVLGTKFSWLDIAAYGVGLTIASTLDKTIWNRLKGS